MSETFWCQCLKHNTQIKKSVFTFVSIVDTWIWVLNGTILIGLPKSVFNSLESLENSCFFSTKRDVAIFTYLLHIFTYAVYFYLIAYSF